MSDDRVWTEFQGVVDGTEAFHAYAFLGPIRVSVSTSTRLCHVGAIILGFLYISIHILAEMDWTIESSYAIWGRLGYISIGDLSYVL